MRRCALAIAASAALVAPAAIAWSNHALGTWAALAALPSLLARPPVPAEPLASLLGSDTAGIAATLAREESWARTHVDAYPPRPNNLAFASDAALPARGLVERFVAATRISPRAKLALYAQLRPGASPGARTVLSASAVTTFEHSESSKLDTFVALREGELVAPIDVVASASDEPDYGMDIGLWSDDGTAEASRYGLGRQPFGNPKVAFASQAPLHMGFFHEAGIVYRAAPFLRRTFPEWRVHLWRALAAEAFASGHPYWGWRFTGWALHYVQDLTQPYHARVWPGASTLRMLSINALDVAGWHAPKDEAIARLTNRHLALENFELRWLHEVLLRSADADPASRALAGTPAAAIPPFDDATVRTRIAREAFDAADAIDAALVATVPARIADDPAYVLGVDEPGLDVRALLAADPARRARLEQALLPLLARFGVWTRALVAAAPAR